MYAYVKGKLVHSSPVYVIVEASGVGYKVFIPCSLLSHLPPLHSELLLHTSHIVREQFQALYGFLSEQERDLFEELTGVSGIGPKTALSLIGHLPIDRMRQAVLNHDAGAISKVPGIGKKTSERLILELKDRLGKKGGAPSPADFAIPVGSDPRGAHLADAMNALMNLGYKQDAAQRAINKSLQSLPEEIDLAVLITDALRHV